MVAVLCFAAFDRSLNCVNGCCLFFLPLMTGLVYCSGLPPPQKKKKKNLQIWFLCQNSLTREQKIRVVGFVLKKLFTHFEILIVSHASNCVNGHYSVSFGSLIYCSGLSVK